MTTYAGGCHCGAVKYEVEADINEVLECDCSHCSKKGFLLYFADKDKFKLLSGADNLTEYFFNKKQIRHLFCKTCGVQSFAEGITFPKIAINTRCLEGLDLAFVSIKAYSGKDL